MVRDVPDVRVPWRDLGNFPRLLGESWRDHRRSGAPLRDLRLYTTWKPGPASRSRGPFMMSFTQYTPKRISDFPAIWQAADVLGEQLVELGGAVGVMTYLQPGRRSAGSLSVWTEESSLAAFIRLPYHVEIMRKYRPRGLPLRSAKWRSEDWRIGPALAEGQRLIDDAGDARVEA